MPPEQCPECGRFLKRELVAGLADAPAPCPSCGIALTAAVLGLVDEASTPPSVRPPDLEPDAVRDRPDPLAGWDPGVPSGAATVRDERPFPTDTVVVVGAGVVGFAAGVIVGRNRGRDAALGALGGLVGAGIARRIWRLP